ncbi:MAG: hypothetical protein FWG01_02745 [Betaproteobacteria bacterium]|nr:hypothetical protein [Betaproteobacteria bacterium]
MEKMLEVLWTEKDRLEKKLQLIEPMTDAERADYARQLETVNSDVDRLKLYIDRPSMQTFSELLFVDDIRLRVKQILNNTVR